MFKSGISWRQAVAIAVAAVLIVSVSLVQGVWSDRWINNRIDIAKLNERVNSIPMSIGDWVGATIEQEAGQLAMTGAVAHISRDYINTQTGERVSVFLVTGARRDITIHTPDACYPAAGFEEVEAQSNYKLKLPAEAVDFQTAAYRKQTPEGVQMLRVFWSWGVDGNWESSEKPRGEFHGANEIYKLYLVNAMKRDNPAPEASAAMRFAQDLLPILDRDLFSKEEKPAAGSTPDPTATATPAVNSETPSKEEQPADEVAPAATATE